MTTSDELLGTSIVRVAGAPGRAKLVDLPLTPQQVPMGVRDEVAEHYGLAEGQFEPMATTLDYLVGATVACLSGTLGGRLGAIGQSTANGRLTAEGRGALVVDGGVIRVRAIHVAYTLTLDDDVDEAKVRRAHETHARYCPIARSIGGCIEITSEITVRNGRDVRNG
ncbi:OsmC family protein [Streptomyces sp. NPDC049954]|uniref:OsmC family protein n=1 Tax=Streptomyces sp. NPDC049954 TaxID=3155779 RepID=UPI00341873E5